MTNLDGAWARSWVELTAARFAENRGVLIELDRLIGDGDHGENMDRGFSAVTAKLVDVPADAVPGAVLKAVASTLISTVGGAAGPLFGTAYMRAAAAAGDAIQLDSTAIAEMIEAAASGVRARGKAEPGEKTMVDAWQPAADAAARLAAEGASPLAVLEGAAAAANDGAEATTPLIATKGRASYLGERSIGHRDPGAVSSSLVLRAAADAAARS